MRSVKILCFLCVVLLLIACGNDQEAKQEHVWQAQEDALKKAQEVESKVMETLDRQKRTVEEHFEE